jgi:UDPglucose 6-dehydrogenase
MRIVVAGLWHLGTVTAACLAAMGHKVTAFDEDPSVISALQEGNLPVEEPGLRELIETQVRSGQLSLTSDTGSVSGKEVVWIAFDTPVDENDIADVENVFQRAAVLLPVMSEAAIMLVSSQMPTGSVARLEKYYKDLSLTNHIRFACAPENLRLGRAIQTFMRPDRVVVGVRSSEDKRLLLPIWKPLSCPIEWMSIESAEMTKHAINAFLATSVAFINELSRICEQVGADAGEVERGLKSDLRIGRGAYLHPGAAFAGGTLARDVMFLRKIALQNGIDPALFDGVKASNDIHQNWFQTRFMEYLGDPRGQTVAVLGLTYKPGTSTLRRSSAVEACVWLLRKGARVMAYDPEITGGKPDIPELVQLADAAERALNGADSLLVGTAWPEFLLLSPDAVVARMKSPIVFDPSGHLEDTLGKDQRILYYSVGRGR